MPVGRPVAAPRPEAERAELQLHEGERPVTAGGHEARDPDLLGDRIIRPPAIARDAATATEHRPHEGRELGARERPADADGPQYQSHPGARSVGLEGNEAGGVRVLWDVSVRRVAAEDIAPQEGVARFQIRSEED